MATISFTLNEKAERVTTEPDRPLLEVLREDLKLVGTRYGCGEGACGACSVIVDGRRMFSCSVAVSEVEGKKVTTIEGLAAGDKLHPLQQAFLDESAFQCAFCTSGMIMTCASLLSRKPNPNEQEIKEALNGNICRCCIQPQIVKAVQKASAQMATGRQS